MTKKKTSKSNAEQEVVIPATLYMRASNNKALLRREFLSPIESLESSFVLAVVADSHKGEFISGFNAVVLCHSTRVVCLEFPLATPQARNASLYKIGILLGTLESSGRLCFLTQRQSRTRLRR